MKTPKKELKALLNLAKECLEQPDSVVCKEYKGKILDACPSLKKDDAVFKAGDWAFVNQFGHKENETLVLLRDSNLEYYPFRAIKLNGKEGDVFNSSLLIKADPKKVEELLIAEAKKRGYEKGNYKCLVIPNATMHKDGFFYKEDVNQLWRGKRGNADCVFDKGQWADILETISLSEAERRLNLKIKID